VGVAASGGRRARQGLHDRDRCDDAGGERGDAEHRAPGDWRRVRRVVDPAGGGLRDPDATRAELARFDRTRKKKGSNDDLAHPHDPDAKIAKMKDRRTYLAHAAEHAVDLETGAIVAVTVQDADVGDTATLVATL
jgi:hypothetical protein